MALSPDQRRRLLRMNMLMSYAAFASSKAVAWTPATLFANAEVGGWYDPSDLTTLFQDAAGTTPVTAVEQPVGRVLDKSGRGNHLSQSTSTARPVLKQDANGCYYLKFDGTDDSLSSGSIDFTSTDKMSVFLGLRKLSNAAQGMVCEISTAVSGNAGSFNIQSPGSNGNDYFVTARGSIGTTGVSEIVSAPDTSIISGLFDIPGDSIVVRRNGAQTGSNTGDQGTGNYGNYPLFIGSRNNATFRFNGHLYSLIVRGAATDAATIASTETWVNSKTRAY